MVHNCKNGIFSLACGEPRDEIHCYLLKGECVSSCRDAIRGGTRPVGDDFILLTSCTSLYVVSYPCVHSFPLPALLYSPYGFVSTRVTSCRVVVCPRH
jgi:hypothetical protein